MTQNVRDQIQALVEEIAHKDDLDPTANLFETGDLSSVHVIDLIVGLEEGFGISVLPDDLSVENFASIDQMIAYTERAIARAG